MTVNLFWRFQVEDFDSWLNPDPDGLAQMFKEQGSQPTACIATQMIRMRSWFICSSRMRMP